MRRLLICIHDVTPAFARETAVMLRDLAPLVGRRLSLAVVPDWHGRWPLTAYPEYCRLIREGAEELLLHGYFHRRRRGRGPVSLLTDRADEMNGLDPEDTRRTIERGQHVFAEVFGTTARGFLAPAWQRGHVRLEHADALPLEHVLGFLSLDARTGRKIPVTTWSWDCGPWRWLGHVGHGLGWLRHSLGNRAVVLAIHPRDLARGFWPQILHLTGALVATGYEPSTPTALLEATRLRQAFGEVSP
jgi:hypothetical protein